jgi:hypothetical protein
MKTTAKEIIKRKSKDSKWKLQAELDRIEYLYDVYIGVLKEDREIEVVMKYPQYELGYIICFIPHTFASEILLEFTIDEILRADIK